MLYSCIGSRNSKRLYPDGWYPKNYSDVQHNFDRYLHFTNCEPGEQIASIGTGNGAHELAISCFVSNIHWHLQEIDLVRLYQFPNVIGHFQQLKDGANGQKEGRIARQL